MTTHKPHKWAIVSYVRGGEIRHKIYGSWKGGYLDGDAWRLSSDIESTSIDGVRLNVKVKSGSTYVLHREMYGVMVYAAGVLERLKVNHSNEKFSLLPEEEAVALLTGATNEKQA